MKKQETKTEKPTKFERIFEDEESKSLWKYDLKKNPNGPVSVEYSYKSHFVKSWEMYKKRGR
jgi:hypothetical protein